MVRASFSCASCGCEINNGERFRITGVMSNKIRQGAIGRTDVQVKMLGELSCERCMSPRSPEAGGISQRPDDS